MSTNGGTAPIDHNWSMMDLWEKYEEIAMHFNDLIIRLRIQALTAAAAISTLVGIFSKSSDSNSALSWESLEVVFVLLGVFWVAIWIIDFCYYNRLLTGAVAAIKEIERSSKTPAANPPINISTRIEEAVAGKKLAERKPLAERVVLNFGRWAFYTLVFAALSSGYLYSKAQARKQLTFAHHGQKQALTKWQMLSLLNCATLKDGHLLGTIFNQNADIAVKQVTFEVTAERGTTAATPNLFNVDVTAEPHAQSPTFDVDTGLRGPAYTTTVVGASGVNVDQ